MVRVDHLVSISSSLYALSGKNIYRNAEGSEQWSLLQSYRGVSVLSATSLNEELFLGTAGGGVFECNKDNKECMPLNDGLLKGDRYITAMSTSENTLYAAVYPEGVFRFNSALMQWSAVGSGLPSEKISALAVREGEIFAAILGDVFSLKKGGTTWEAKSEGLMGKTQVENLIVASGNLYAGTDIGVFKWMVAKQQWKIENQNLNLSNRKAFPAKTSNWFASRIHPQKEVALSISFAPTDFNFNSVESMAEKDNDLYVAIEGRVFLHGHQSQKWIPLEKGLEGVYVYSLTTDKKSVFAGTNFGVYKLSD